MFDRIALELQQYGLQPNDIITRLKLRFNSNSFLTCKPVLANSIPKSGTNLLLRALYLSPHYSRVLAKTLQQDNSDTRRIINSLKAGRFCAAHLKYHADLQACLQQAEVAHVLMVRDPRDIAVSNAHYITHIDKRHRLHNYFNQNLHTEHERIMAAIEGIPAEKLGGQASLPLKTHYSAYLDWLQHTDCHIIRFEDLIGERGGGDPSTQTATLTSLYQYLGDQNAAATCELVRQTLFSSASRTFNKGKIGTWQDKLSDEHIEALDDLLHISEQLGYSV